VPMNKLWLKNNNQLGEPSAFAGAEDDNLIKWQLELDNILERIDHLLRGHRLEFNNGHIVWTAAKNEDEVLLNDYGVNEILRILSLYLNRNTILSNYTEEQVETKAFDFGTEVADLIEFKYEEMGLNTQKKMMVYPMLLRELVDVIHSAYLRALKGGERQSLREARQVMQQAPAFGSNQGMVGNGMPGKERGLLNPLRYIRGKYA